MGKRLELQTLLQSLIGVRSDGLANVYFQPPESSKMNYPCIRYTRNRMYTRFANDTPYLHKMGYQLMVIDRDPDSPILDKIAQLPSCVFDRHYSADNLNHDIYNLYF